jgi:hypothetical protein
MWRDPQDRSELNLRRVLKPQSEIPESPGIGEAFAVQAALDSIDRCVNRESRLGSRLDALGPVSIKLPVASALAASALFGSEGSGLGLEQASQALQRLLSTQYC